MPLPFHKDRDWTILVLCLVLVIAGFMRLFDINFDQNTHQHPDERFITQVALDRVNLPQGVTLGQLLDPAHSPLNPRINGQDFHYGALPLYLVKGIAVLGDKFINHPEQGHMPWSSYDGIPLVGRTTAALFDLLTVLLVFLIARRLYGRMAGLLAAIFSAFAVIQIQIAHFYIVEPFLVTFLTAALYFSVVLMQTRRAWAAAAAGLMLGFALACKVSVVAVAVLIVAAVALRVAYRARTRQLGPPADLDDPYGLEPASRAERAATFSDAAWPAFGLLVLAGVMTLVGFAVGDPYGVFDSGLIISFDPNAVFAGTTFFQLGPFQLLALTGKYLAQLGNEAAIQKGTADVPYTIQFVGTTPVLYHLQQLVQWGMGPASGIVAVAGLLVTFWLAVVRRRAAEILLLSGMIPYFLTIVTLEAKWPRYMLPEVPYLCILGAMLLARGLQWSAAVAPRIAAWRARHPGYPFGLTVRRWIFPGLAALAVLGSLLWAIAFMNIYTHDHSRVIASRWLDENIPAGANIAHETWDDALPLGLPNEPNGPWGSVDMGLYDFHPSPEEFDTIANWLQQADYIVISSNRLYGSIPHEPWRYPVQMRYYDLLLSGKLGFEEILPPQDQKVYPEIFGIKINDDAVDESFTVYDHPRVLAFKKVRSLSTDELRMLFGSSTNQPAVNIRHLQIHTPRDYDKSLLMAQPPGQQLALDDYAWNPLAQNQWVAAVLWFLAIEVLGLLAWPITALVCRRLPDRGYPLSKTLALVLVTWLVWMAASLRLVPFTVYSILGAIVILAVTGALLWRRFAPELRPWMAAHRRLILGWEALFTVAFIAFLIIRMLDPDLWQPWNGGEKPMEFGFLNSILRSPWMPPGDPFFSGGYINYYYYGWVGLGVLIKLLGIDPAVGFNLSIPLLFGLTVLGGASIVYNAIATVQRARGWRPAVSFTAFGWGVLGSVLLAVIGNLTFLLQFISMKAPNLQQALVDFIRARGGQIPADAQLLHSYAGGFDYWAARSVIDNKTNGVTINEWPYWTFLFADLHPHLIDMSYSVLALGLIFNLVLGAWRWPLAVPLPAAFTEAPVPPVPAPGVLAQPTVRPLWRATLEATVRLWGSSWGDALFRFLITALCLGILFAVNSWDFPVYLVVAAGALFVTVLLAYQAHAVRRGAIRLGAAIAALVGLVLAAGAGLAFYAPFILTFKPFYNQIKFITEDTLTNLGLQRTGLPEFLSIWGLFVFVSLSYLALQLWKYPWAASFRGLSELVTGRPPRPAPALAQPTPVASTVAAADLEMSRFRPASAVPAEATALAPVTVVAQAPSGNGHAEVEAAATPLAAPAPPAEEWEEYGLADVGALDLELDEAELARQRHTRTAVAPSGAGSNGHTDGPAPSGNGHDADLNDYDYADVPPFEPQIVLESAPLVEAPPAQADELAYGLDNLSAPSLPPGAEPLATRKAADALATAPSTNAVDAEDLIPPPPTKGYIVESAVEEAPALRAQHSALSTRLPGLLWPVVGAVLMLLTVLGSAFTVLRHEGLSALLILLVGGLIATHLGAVRNPGQLLGGLLMAAGWGIALGVEYVYLADHLAGGSAFRMNTVFKFYEQVWVLVACGTAIALYAMLGPRGRGTPATQSAVSTTSVLDSSPVAPAEADTGTVVAAEPAPLTVAPAETPADEMALYVRPTQAPETEELPSATGEAPLADAVEAHAEAPDPALAEVVAAEATAAEPDAPALTTPDGIHTVDTPIAAPVEPEADDTTTTSRTLEYTLAPVEAGSTGGSDWFSFPRLIWLVPFAVLFLGSLIFTVSGTQARVADRMPSESARPSGTLNGMDWMDKTTLTLSFDEGASGPIIYKFEREALDWMNTHIKGTPVIAAAPREYYRQSGMLVGTYTGLPMVVGGLHQDEQRYDWEVGERRGDMDTFFRNPDIPTALLLINKYDIDYIYLGQIETVGYQADAAGLAKFKDMEGTYLEVAYKNDLVTVYHVLRPKVAADVGAAPGTVRPEATPRPVPTDVPLGDDPTLKSLQAAVDADPNNVDARRALGEYFRAHGAPQKAIEQYVVVAQLAPQDVAAHHILGDLYQDNGQPDQALAAWEDALKNAKDADKPAAYNKVGIAYQQRQRFDDAIKAFQGAVAADPHFAEAWFHLGETYQTMQNVDAARAAYQNCIKNAPNDDSGRSWSQNAQKALDLLH